MRSPNFGFIFSRAAFTVAFAAVAAAFALSIAVALILNLATV
jgi:hypothetical protein